MDNIKNKCLSESGNTDSESTDMKERAELSDTPPPGREEVTEDNYNESPRNENAEEGDTEDSPDLRLWSNNLIMREIMSHLDWRELVRCELVCRLWRDAVESLQRVNLRSYDFTVQLRRIPELCDDRTARSESKLEVSYLPVQTRPMFAIAFYTGRSLPKCLLPCANRHKVATVPAIRHSEPRLGRRRCNWRKPDRACDGSNCAIDTMQQILSKYSRQLTVGKSNIIYKPLPSSRTSQYTMPGSPGTTLAGLCLPTMPNVNYRTVQYLPEHKDDFYRVVDDICTSDIIKGVVVFGDPECLYQADFVFLNYIKNKQPSIPYALGGCVTSEVLGDVSNWVDPTMAVFSVPKEPEEPVTCCQFNMYSLIIDSTVEEEAAIQKVIQTFAGNISELQYSAALVLSHNRSDKRLYTELNLFRDSFPRTTAVGRNSQLAIIGSNHPDTRPQPTQGTKRLRNYYYDSESEFIYNDSTMFVYFSWGKERNSGVEARH